MKLKPTHNKKLFKNLLGLNFFCDILWYVNHTEIKKLIEKAWINETVFFPQTSFIKYVCFLFVEGYGYIWHVVTYGKDKNQTSVKLIKTNKFSVR